MRSYSDRIIHGQRDNRFVLQLLAINFNSSRGDMKTLLKAALLVALITAAVFAQFNAGQMKGDANSLT